MKNPEFGTVEYYQEHFADILSEAGIGEVPGHDPDLVAANIIEGFELAVNDWLCYHEDCCKNYRDLHARFLMINRD